MKESIIATRTKKFVVFNHDHEIYIYDSDADDRLLATGKSKLFSSLEEAKKAAKENLEKFYESKKLFIDNLEYKDF